MTDHIAQLRSIFPAIDEEAISSVLTHCRNDVNAAIEKLLTFSENSSNYSNAPQTVAQEDMSSKPVEKRSHTIQQYSWMNLPPLSPAKQDSETAAGVTPSSQWGYAHSLYGAPQSVTTDDKSSSNTVQPVVKQLPRQQQALPTHGQARKPVKKLILMRGLPGSGKSTLARKLKGQNGSIFSTDDYYIVDGVYQFDGSKLGEYHELNQRRAKEAMRHGISPVIVDNTNTKCHEMRPYVAAALQFNYAVEFHEPDTPWKFNVNTLARKNIHGVSKVVLERMLDRYERHVTMDMVMGTNKSRTVANRDGPANGNKAGGFLIARSAPVTMSTSQHTSPRCKMKRYSHGNQATSWHGNHSGVSRWNKGNWLRRVDNSSLTTCDTSQSSNTTNNSDISNNSTPSFAIPSTLHNNISEGLSIDTSQYTNDIQSLSPSTEVAQQSEQHIEENHSCPVSDLVYARTHQNNSYYLHYSLSDSVIPLATHHLSNEPFHVVPRNTEHVPSASSSVVYDDCVKKSSSLVNEDSNSSTIEKWSSTELYQDSDDDNFIDDQTDHPDNQTDHHAGVVAEGNDDDNGGILMIDTNNNSLTQLAENDNDIDFLKSCFPAILSDQVVTVYNECDRNIETAVGKLLLLPTGGSAAKVTEEFNDVSDSNEEVRRSFQEEELSNQTVDEEVEDVTSVEEDEKIARALQDQLNKAFMEEEKLSNLATRKAQSESCPAANSSHDDEGLVLRLPPSLATTLEGMFGSVKEYLVTDGEPSGDDLVVLLSQKVAKEIYKKWLDTLKAKQIEIRHNNSVQLRKDIELAQQLQREEGGQLLVREEDQVAAHKTEVQWKRHHRSKQRKQNPLAAKSSNQNHSLPTAPSPYLKDIIQQQGIVEQESQQMSEIVQDACKNSAATHIKVQDLYHSFPSLSQHYIDQLILDHQFNFDQVASELYRRQAYKPISVVANPSMTSKPVKMSPRKHETTNDGTVATASNNYNSTKLESWSNLSYEEIRAEAAVHARLRVESFQKAAEARNKKQGDLAVFYAQQGHLHTSKMNDANERAAEMILSKSNASNSDTIDFHGLFVKEAIEALEEKLNTTNKKTIYVVTGKGSHSCGGVARIKPAVIDYLDKNGYRHETVNEGQIKIYVNN